MVRRVFCAVIVISIVMCGDFSEAKRADLAGAWYSSSPDMLRAEIDKYLADAGTVRIKGDLIGLVVPHAGLRFSGPVAGYAYKALAQKAPDTVIVVGFSHKRYFPDRIAVFSDEGFTTPLGRSKIDKEISESLIAYSENIQNIPEAFQSENSIEMQIPFIQTVLKNAKLVLISLCDQRKRNNRLLADALYDVLRGRNNFVVIASTDLSHYLSYPEAKRKDMRTIEEIKAFEPEKFYKNSLEHHHELACGYGAIYVVMDVCGRLGANKVEILDYGTSGDVTGEKGRVVGYLSTAFVKTKTGKKSARREKKGGENMPLHKKFKNGGSQGGRAPLTKLSASGSSKSRKALNLNQSQRDTLLKIARGSIRYYLETGKKMAPEVDDPALKQDMGAFVTLHKHGRLRGCIGNMTATGPLYLAVRDMAVAAAVRDPRFPPLTLEELKDVDIEISALSPMRRITDYNDIEIGRHGVMVKQGFRSGVYLPQVARETGWSRDQFMNSLCGDKAGISPGAWKTGECDIEVFTAEVFGEKGAEK